MKWSRLTGDVETSAERGKTRRSLYLSQSKVSIDHLIQHCRPLQTFIIGVSGDSHVLAQSPATHCLLRQPRDWLADLPLHPTQTTHPSQPTYHLSRALLHDLEPQQEVDLDLIEADNPPCCSV